MAEWFSPTQSRGLWREASESDLLVTGSLSGRFKVMGSFPGLALNRIVRCKQLRPKIQEGKEQRGGGAIGAHKVRGRYYDRCGQNR
jgi:hypothetical protein